MCSLAGPTQSSGQTPSQLKSAAAFETLVLNTLQPEALQTACVLSDMQRLSRVIQQKPYRCKSQRATRLFPVYAHFTPAELLNYRSSLETLKWAGRATGLRDKNPPDSDTAGHTGI